VTAISVKSETQEELFLKKQTVSFDKYPVAEPEPYVILVVSEDNYMKSVDSDVLYEESQSEQSVVGTHSHYERG
jgi:hypothetical protein